MDKKSNEIRDSVRESYSKAVENAPSGCGCCSSDSSVLFYQKSAKAGYSDAEISSVPIGANLGLGCGNPQAIAGLEKGETVVDLGSGAGFDVFLAARQVGNTGKVIGVDMTPAMISRARQNAAKSNITNVEFRLGEIENIPVPDNSVDVIMSNCVINLSPEKQKVFDDAYRVLKPGGRLAIADNIALAELPEEIKNNMEHYSACISGASLKKDLEDMIKASGFENIRITPVDKSRSLSDEITQGGNVRDYVLSVTIEAVKQ